MIAIRLLLLTLSLYGLSRLAMRRLRLPVEGALPLTMVSAATLTTLAGMLNLLAIIDSASRAGSKDEASAEAAS